MRAVLLVALLFLPWAGCVGADSAGPRKGVGTAGVIPADNSTLEGVFLQAPSLKVVGPATIIWSVENGTTEKPAVRTTLLWLSDDFKPSFQGVTGSLSLVAFIPADGPTTSSECEAVPKTIRSWYPPRDGTKYPGLTANFAHGWYHVVIVSTSSGDFQISFDTQKEGRARTMPGPDPWAGGGYKGVAGGRELSVDGEAPTDASWVGFATDRVGTNSIDGGREHSVTLACQTTKTTVAPPTASYSTNKGAVTVGAVGKSTKIPVTGSYKPYLTQTAGSSTSLEAAWAWTKMPTLTPK